MGPKVPATYQDDFERKGHFQPVDLFSEDAMAEMGLAMQSLIEENKKA